MTFQIDCDYTIVIELKSFCRASMRILITGYQNYLQVPEHDANKLCICYESCMPFFSSFSDAFINIETNYSSTCRPIYPSPDRITLLAYLHQNTLLSLTKETDLSIYDITNPVFINSTYFKA